MSSHIETWMMKRASGTACELPPLVLKDLKGLEVSLNILHPTPIKNRIK